MGGGARNGGLGGGGAGTGCGGGAGGRTAWSWAGSGKGAGPKSKAGGGGADGFEGPPRVRTAFAFTRFRGAEGSLDLANSMIGPSERTACGTSEGAAKAARSSPSTSEYAAPPAPAAVPARARPPIARACGAKGEGGSFQGQSIATDELMRRQTVQKLWSGFTAQW